MTPRVSIVTAVRDGARTIAETLASVQAQSEPAWEHIVVDDGSRDDTAAVVAAAADPRLRWVPRPHAGRSAARNHGIELAAGEWLLFLDADDALEPDALRAHLGHLAAHPEYDASIGDGWFCGDGGERLARFSERRERVAPGDILAALVANPGLYGAPLAIMMRAAAVRRHGVRFDPALTIGEDNRFVIELARHARFGFVDALTCRYRWHAGSTSLRASAAERRAELWRALHDVPALPEFARLPVAARERFFHRALIEWLADRPDEQQRVGRSPPFMDLPDAARARLLRLAASEHLLAGRDRPASALLRQAAALAAADPTVRVLRGLARVHPRLAALAVRARRAFDRRREDALWRPRPEPDARHEGLAAPVSVLLPPGSGPPHAREVLVVILNWRSAADTVSCLEALDRSAYPHARILVVDNGSGDGSLDVIRARRPEVEVLALADNHGYAGGNNRGIAHGLGDRGWVWLLNPDTIVAPDCLAALLDAGERDPRIGFLGPLLLMRDDPERVLSAGGLIVGGWSRHRGAGELDRGQFLESARVDYVMGCALLVRRAVLERIGGLDERYFLYGEEADWCRRAAAHGFTSVVVPRARAWHPNTAARDAESAAVTYYMARNQLRFVRAHRLGTTVLARHLFRHLRTLASWSVRPQWRHKGAQRRALRRALLDFLRGRTGPLRD